MPPVLLVLKNDWIQKFKIAIDLLVYDQPGKILRFTVLYLLLSLTFNTRLFAVTQTTEHLGLESVISIYKSINWSEREVWDMFGIFIFGHPDLRRILTDYGFTSFPLRKDFPVSGFRELKFFEITVRLGYVILELIQASREFNESAPWLKFEKRVEPTVFLFHEIGEEGETEEIEVEIKNDPFDLRQKLQDEFKQCVLSYLFDLN